MRIFKELGWFFKEEKWSYFWGIAALFVIAILNLIPPLIMGELIDLIDTNTLTTNTLITTLVYIILLAFIVYALRYVWRICIFGASFRLERKMRSNLFVHFTKMSSSFYHEHRVGDLMAHATNDLKSVQRVAGGGILQFADALLTGISVIIAMAVSINWKLTIIALLPMPLMIIGSQVLSKKLHTTFTKAQEAFSSMNNRTHEAVSGIKVTKTFGQEEAEIRRFGEETEDVYQKNMAVTKYDAAFDPLITIVIVLCFIFVFIAGAIFIDNGDITIGQLVAFVNYIHLLVWPMLAFGFLYNTVERGNVSYERIKTLLNIEADIKNKENAITIPPKGNLVVKLDSYIYPDEELPVLQNINFSLKQGETLGIVGKTGAGKTTLIKLLLREYDSLGRILYDGKDIKEYHLDTLHQCIGYVPQDQFLFSTTIEDNIRFGNMDASIKEVQEAARIACVHEDIMGFEEQYQTIIGERGVSLSGGQKQRIAIARALLLNPEILILDDALSAVDAKTEEAILDALKKNRQNKTTIIVAHRLSAIKHAKLILVLEEGKIEERGDHPTLIKNNGWYADIFNKQELFRVVKQHG
ncbi:MAG: ABC transporter ATP-binding protein [Coprobacillaceae bacterium]